MASNSKMNKAKTAKCDEFYTQMCDIIKEMEYYDFKGKTVYCNCDGADSNFVKYFKNNFARIGLKKLIYTSYNPTGNGYGAEVVSDGNGGWVESKFALMEDGDFRSDECRMYLKMSDVVVTNPPFSLFRDFIKLMTEYWKDFIVLGNVLAIHYKEIFPLFMNNRIKLGVTIHSGDREFEVPESYPLFADNCRVAEDGKKYVRVTGIRWFTTLDNNMSKSKLILTERYSPSLYPKYDKDDAINISRVVNIPKDYDGVMGVPLTFMDKYNPEQFEILGLLETATIDGKSIYSRILIKNKFLKNAKAMV